MRDRDQELRIDSFILVWIIEKSEKINIYRQEMNGEKKHKEIVR